MSGLDLFGGNVWWILWTASASARTDDVPLLQFAPDPREYHRLTGEMAKLARRNVWSGVERLYASLPETGVAYGVVDHLRGAEAALSRGDVTLARERLVRAHWIETDRRVVEWLWDLDQRYGAVTLEGRAEPVSPAAGPSRPDELRAVARANEALLGAAAFTGLLPVGAYRWGAFTFEVRPFREPVYLDAAGSRARRRPDG